MRLLRKARRAAEKQNRKVEKARQKEGKKQKEIYRATSTRTGFSSESEWDEYCESLLVRHKGGETLTLKEADILCLALRPEERIKYSICDNTRFTMLYLNHFDGAINNYSLTAEEQRQLNEFASDWENKIWDEAMSNDRIYLEIRKETKNRIKEMRKHFADTGLSSEDISEKEKEMILRSKSVYIKVNEVLESLDTNELILGICGEEIHIDEFTLIHTFFRHYSELTKQYDDKKSYFTPEIHYDHLPIILKEKILEPIEKSGVFGSSLPQGIFIKYYGRLYKIYFNEKSVNSGHDTVRRINTFYPVDQKTELQDSKKYNFKKINKNLQVGVIPNA